MTQQKGKGLIFLLHGSPGTGKTLTAELVAEHTKRPLLKISTGEPGSYEERMSAELEKLLAWASTWKAIVLIDEADVFLEQRKSGPVSVRSEQPGSDLSPAARVVSGHSVSDQQPRVRV